MWVYIIIIVCALSYYYSIRNFKYWSKKGVKSDPPAPLFGHHFRGFFRIKSMTELFEEMYFKYPHEKYVGYFFANDPTLIIRDPELVKHVLVTDFSHFYPRGLNPHKTVIEPLMKNLFFADGDLWKLLRQRMTPAFTSGKLKAMFPLIVDRAEVLQKLAGQAASTNKEIDVRDLMARYTTDFIGACGFGIDSKSLDDENTAFRKIGKRIFNPSIRDACTAILKAVAPEIFKHLHFMSSSEIQEPLYELVDYIIQSRNNKPSGRNDFIDLMLELKAKGKIIGESIEKQNADGTPAVAELELDRLLLAAQVFVFFAAGFETSSSATSFTLHQLAFNPHVQKRCQEEIDMVLLKYDNKLSYDAIREMKYLDWTFREGMRIFPSLGFLIRECARPYTFPGTDLSIDKGVSIIIPLQAMHNDEMYFENPKEFIPERHSPENVKNIRNHVYLPFGEGPRACIGERLGLMQSLAGLAAILSKYSVEPSENTKRWPSTDPKSGIVQSIAGGIPLKLVERKKNL